MSKAWTNVAGGFNQNLTLTNPCSGNAWEPNTFGPGRGFTDRLYLTGEETFGSTGHYWALDTATSTLYQAPAVGGGGSWESATVIDTGRTDTIALLLGEDRGALNTGTARLSLYVGPKDSNSSDFLVRNGLVGGKTYYWDANGTSNTNGTLSAGGLFANNNDLVQGTWKESTTEAVLFSKAEDVHTNMQPSSPKFGKEAVLASQNQAIFQIDFSGITFTAGDLTPGSISSVTVLFKNETNIDQAGLFGGFDNLVWSADGNVYVNEDDTEGDIWQVNVAGLNAQYQLGDLNPSLSNVFQILDADPIAAHAGGVALGITESSGIIDISSFVGYAPGSIFLADGQGTSSDQLVLLVSPTASVIPEPSLVAGCLVLVCGAALYRRRAGRNG
jgi:glycerophosphoryl diester phosphodiesterase